MFSSWLLLLITVILSPQCGGDSIYDHEVKYYEIITLLAKTSKIGVEPTTELEVQFHAFNRSFCLHLLEDRGFQALEIEFLETREPRQLFPINSTFFEGITNGTTSDSFAAGYLCDEVFCGIFSENGIVYFIESAEIFFSDSHYSGRGVIYRRDDVESIVQDPLAHTFEDSPMHRTSEKSSIRNLLFPGRGNYFGSFSYPKGIDKSSQPNTDYACRIEMVADHTLYQYFNKDTDALSAFLYLHGKYADSVFRKTDFDGDGLKDNIRIIVKKIFVYKSANEANYPMAVAADLLDFLQRFTKRTQNYCLSVCMCFRRYSSPAIGRAFKPTSGTPGGICQKVLKLRASGFTYVPSSLNTAVITIRNSRGQTLPLITTMLAVTHEIGHSFGSDHDSMDNLLCSPGGEKGYYLMHPKTTRKLKDNSNIFSPCSRREIHRTLKERGECLKVYTGTCGNGIREGNEQCDCGWEKICDVLDSCCTPADAKPPEKPCTFRKSTGAHCSPKESPCCSDDCSLSVSNKIVCYRSDPECLISYCGKNSSSCPIPVKAPDGYPCQSNSKTCQGGSCNSSICQDNGLKSCICKERQACYVCCEKNNQCQPAHTIGLKNEWTNIFVSLAGSSCKGSGNFRCDGSGNCIDVKARKINDKVGEGVLWWALALLLAVLVTLIFTFLYFLKSHLEPIILVPSTTNVSS